MWPRRDLIEKIEGEHPIFQAPMGWEATAALAAAVSNAGAVGGVRCSFKSAQDLRILNK